jgi:hypothetical protein
LSAGVGVAATSYHATALRAILGKAHRFIDTNIEIFMTTDQQHHNSMMMEMVMRTPRGASSMLSAR